MRVLCELADITVEVLRERVSVTFDKGLRWCRIELTPKEVREFKKLLTKAVKELDTQDSK